MNQRVEVRLIVKKDDKILLLKRAGGQGDLLGKFEVPGSEIHAGEQPEEAVTRLIKESIGLEVNVSYLSDVFTYVEQDKRPVQRVVIVYAVSVSGGRRDIQLAPRYSRYLWKTPSEINQEGVTELSYMLLAANKEKPGVSATVDSIKIRSDVSYAKKKQSGVVIYSDGGSRGNPGPSAAGFVIKDMNDSLAYEGGAYLGITTNNQAEYHGVRLGLEKARELGVKSVECNIDSMLVVNQLNGQYVIRNRELWPIHERIKELIGQFDQVTFRHIKREFNQQADGMVNKILDARERKENREI